MSLKKLVFRIRSPAGKILFPLNVPNLSSAVAGMNYRSDACMYLSFAGHMAETRALPACSGQLTLLLQHLCARLLRYCSVPGSADCLD